MGYDIHMVETPTTVPEGLELQNPDMPGYHRFNIRAMPLTIGAMEWADCITYARAPEFPLFPFQDEQRGVDVLDFVLYAEDWEDLPGEEPIEFIQPTDEEIKLATEYLAHVEALLTAPNPEGVPPSYKFESNSGWLVTPEECRTIADKIDEHKEMIAGQFFTDAGMTADDGRTWLTMWANYNRLAADHGGYRVR